MNLFKNMVGGNDDLKAELEKKTAHIEKLRTKLKEFKKIQE